ncbi:hypothetical protein QDX21_04540 [Auritidibacter ignavus]|uniref:Uncharacterized protein n=1 Tax=Auritidibacter ignavus TaxID=678932 RepID=A0AAJ6DCV7_9MICC|nr:hypothetical protein [Auritidibacter ignavus]WGH94065.1 hypothetical protein QDX21_04540 [Auritidibacter ignavus]WHS34562.1 hypothetical protein QM403_09575 [Auritidibacter ignavus]
MNTSPASLGELLGLKATRFQKLMSGSLDWLVTIGPELALMDPDTIRVLTHRTKGIGAAGVVGLADRDDHWEVIGYAADGQQLDDPTEALRVAAEVITAHGGQSTPRGLTLTCHQGPRPGSYQLDSPQPGWWSVRTPDWSFADPEQARSHAVDALVKCAGLPDPRPGLSIQSHNRRFVIVALGSEEEFEAASTQSLPGIEPPAQEDPVVGLVLMADPVVSNGKGQLRLKLSQRPSDMHTGATAAAAATTAVKTWAHLPHEMPWRVLAAGTEYSVHCATAPEGSNGLDVATPVTWLFDAVL